MKKDTDFFFLSDHECVVKLDNKKVIWMNFYFHTDKDDLLLHYIHYNFFRE